jgi:hypothetical protein
MWQPPLTSWAPRTLQWDMCIFVVCFSLLVARLVRPSEHAFQFVPAASAVAATAVLIALCVATFCHRWCEAECLPESCCGLGGRSVHLLPASWAGQALVRCCNISHLVLRACR